MDRFPTPLEFLAHRQTLSWLLVPVMFLPIAMTILFIFGRVFAFMQDTFSAAILDWTALALGLLWCLLLIFLLLCTVLMLLRKEPKE